MRETEKLKVDTYKKIYDRNWSGKLFVEINKSKKKLQGKYCIERMLKGLQVKKRKFEYTNNKKFIEKGN